MNFSASKAVEFSRGHPFSEVYRFVAPKQVRMISAVTEVEQGEGLQPGGLGRLIISWFGCSSFPEPTEKLIADVKFLRSANQRG